MKPRLLVNHHLYKTLVRAVVHLPDYIEVRKFHYFCSSSAANVRRAIKESKIPFYDEFFDQATECFSEEHKEYDVRLSALWVIRLASIQEIDSNFLNCRPWYYTDDICRKCELATIRTWPYYKSYPPATLADLLKPRRLRAHAGVPYPTNPPRVTRSFDESFQRALETAAVDIKAGLERR